MIEKVQDAFKEACLIKGVAPSKVKGYIVYMQETDAKEYYEEILKGSAFPTWISYEEFVRESTIRVDPNVKQGTVEIWFL